MVLPRVNMPDASASLIIRKAARSFTEPPGLPRSSLARIRTSGRSRAVIFEQLYESDSNASDTVIEVLMSTLRAKLARAGLPDLIETRRACPGRSKSA